MGLGNSLVRKERDCAGLLLIGQRLLKDRKQHAMHIDENYQEKKRKLAKEE